MLTTEINLLCDGCGMKLRFWVAGAQTPRAGVILRAMHWGLMNDGQYCPKCFRLVREEQNENDMPLVVAGRAGGLPNSVPAANAAHAEVDDTGSVRG